MNSHYSQQDYWNMLPLNQEQRKKIIKDFIETGEYDKIEKKEMEERAGAPMTPAPLSSDQVSKRQDAFLELKVKINSEDKELCSKA